ncbi:MAG: hypothetical protein ACYCSG_04865 [Thermoplasmataceae archaeon]
MKHVMKPGYRYPLFFLGLFIIELGGLAYRFMSFSIQDVEIFAVVGFLIFLSSLITP